jgi:putative ABC transport system permease protein
MVKARTKMLFRDLAHLRGQVLAVTIVVACGVASFVSMRATYWSLLLTQAAYYSEYRFADVFANVKRAPESLAEEIRAIPGVAAVQTRVVRDVTLDVPGLEEPAIGRLVSIPERRAPVLNDLFLRSGRWVEPGRSDEVLASEAFATANQLKLGDTISAILNGRWVRLRIVGIALSPEYIYEIRGGGSIFPDNRRFGVLWISREVIGPAFQMDGAFNDVAVSLARGAREADVIARLDRLLDRYGGLGAYGREDQISNRFISDEIKQNRVSSIYTPAIFLAVSAFLIHIVLSRLVALQRPHIALLKAFGYSNAMVGMHYMKMALLAVSGGTAIGVGLGVWLGHVFAAVYQDFYRFPILRFEWRLDVIGLGAAISLASAAVGAWVAVRSAVILPPAEAMRPEPPADFRPGIVERLGIGAFFSSSFRMILRNIERQPWRSGLTVLGLALAVGILVIGRYFFDAMDFMMELQFEIAQREDVMVAFREPLTSQAAYDVARLEGVLLSEPYREAPARLRAGHRSKRIGILGLDPGGELRRLIDQKLEAVPLSPNGLVLTEALADHLGVKPGSRIRVEILEGERAVRDVVVADVVDEILGFSAYMQRDALNRLLGESGATSGAYLAVDSKAAPALYARLKRTPAVSGVAIREATLRSFDEIVAQSLKISTNVLIFFACAIAFGVVYNSARVALSERGKELASLRILGFTKREIGVLLLGEQALLTLAAIPVGLAIGHATCALLTELMQTELYRMPLVMTGQTYVFATLVVAAAALVSGLAVARRLANLDLIEVLKTRE